MSDQATDESRQIWDSLASGWDKERAFINEIEGHVTGRMHEAMDVRPGDIILELCAGPGEVGLRLAEQHPEVQVLLTDFAPGMVHAAANEANRRGLTNVECRPTDAQDIDLPDGSVDGVLCRYGLMLVPDIAKAFSEIRRVLAPKSTFLLNDWIRQPLSKYLAYRREVLGECEAETGRGFRLFPVHNKFTPGDWRWLLTEAGLAIRHQAQLRDSHQIFVCQPAA